MRLTPAQMDDAIEHRFEFERRDDVDGVLATLSDDAAHDVFVRLGGAPRGRDNARAFCEALFRDPADARVETVRRLRGSGFVVDESFWRGRSRGRPFGLGDTENVRAIQAQMADR